MQVISSFLYLEAVTCLGLLAVWALLPKGVRKQLLFKKLAVLILLWPLVGHFSPSLILVYSFAFMAPLVLCKTREEVAAVFLVSALMAPPLQTAVIVAETFLMDFGSLDATGLGCLIAFLTRRGPRAFKLNKMDACAIAIILIYVSALARGGSWTALLRLITEYTIHYGVPYLMLTRSLTSSRSVGNAFLALISSTTVLAAVAVFEAVRVWPIYRLMSQRFDVDILIGLKYRYGLLRAEGPVSNPVYFGYIFAVGAIAMLASRHTIVAPARRWLLVLVALTGALATQSRGALLGTIIGLLAVEAYRRRSSALAAVAGFVVAGAIWVPFFSNVSFDLSREAVGTLEYRQSLLEQGLQELKESPVIGFSRPEVDLRMQELRQGEGIVDYVNTYLYVALISGAVGLSIFLACLFFPLRRYWSRPVKSSSAPQADDLAAFAFASLLASIAMITFTSLNQFAFIHILAVIGLSGIGGHYQRISTASKSVTEASKSVPITSDPLNQGQPIIVGASASYNSNGRGS
jgi:hypothetical protein